MFAVGTVFFILVLLFSLSPRSSSAIRINLVQFLAPVQGALETVLRHLGAAAEGFGRLIAAAERNRESEKRLELLYQEVIRLREVERENEDLRSLLAFQRQAPSPGVAARVIGRDVHHWYQSVLIDKGTAHGVRKDSPVVSAQGVVGRVVEVSSRNSRVLLIVDRDSRVGGVIQSSRLGGIVEGLGRGACRITYLPRRGDIGLGEEVVTSGLGIIYPPGLLIGSIAAVYLDEHGLFQYADLEPATDFDRLEQVIVLSPLQ